MKEIMINSNRANDIITRDMISLDEAIIQARSSFIVSIINRAENIGWIQLIMTNEHDVITLREIPYGSNRGNMHPAWRGRDIRGYLHEINASYPRSEFYLIECMEDLCKLMKARCPNSWWDN